MPIALLSVFDKTGSVEWTRDLLNLNLEWQLVASGGTARTLEAAGIPVQDTANFVGGGAILNHRVVTLSREVHAGLLARRPEDEAEMNELALRYIDLVCVGFYPMREAINTPGATVQSVIEQTDVGGPTMAHSGAKGNRIVICDPTDRPRVLQWLREGQPNRTEFINELASKAEATVSNYCLDSARFRSGGKYDGIIGKRVRECCYGENRWQSPAALFSTTPDDPLALDRFEVILGSEPSYVNWCDVDRLLQTVTHIAAVFEKNHGFVPCIAVGGKHGNPCGAAFGTEEAYTINRMVHGDPLALFGGIVMTNFAIDSILAEVLCTAGGKRVLDGVVAPSFDASAITVLRRKNDRCRLYQNLALRHLSQKSLSEAPFVRPVRGGFLQQANYTFVLDRDDIRIEKSGKVAENREADLLLAWAVGSTSTSNTVTLVKDRMLIGNGVGQQDRVGACDLAVRRAQRSGHDIKGSVAYSDSFFPFTDALELLAKAGVAALLTSSGSVNDQKIRDFCAEHGLALWMIPDAIGRGFFGH